ncbi:hypothetical protein JUM001_05040 [Clostridium perfringens]|uniref:hypothetical protein n=1 Tax=Clostridium perfringens TaxID=1502 RepID=UPI002209E125|nr:hypothetical protein [Clostridium perfringens]MDK0762769.1 hypothetical protein [Clostridium perfringens]BDS16270.1 hypothetical protein JUM001_05040 [Clostridium perfringens]
MSMNDLLRKMAVILEKKQDALFSYDVEKQKKYIKKLGNTESDIQRSYFQYKCQMKFNGKITTFILNIVSIPMVFFYIFRYGKNIVKQNIKKVDAVFFRDGKPENILPDSLKLEFEKIEKNPIEGILLTSQDKAFIKQIIAQYPLSWHFILKCIIKIGRYSFVIKKYNPDAIIVCAEYSFTSSVLSLYCKRNEVEHIDVMHGEKLYYMRDSFFRFDRCYVWDEYYKNLLCELNADKEQFVIEVPQSLKIKNTKSNEIQYDYTYYLGSEHVAVLKKIAVILKELKDKGNRICIRPHPRYSDIQQIKKIFSFAIIEISSEVSIEESLLSTKNTVALYSTVLNQALYNSISVIIDDVSNPINYEKLRELEYFCLEKEHKLLSELI